MIDYAALLAEFHIKFVHEVNLKPRIPALETTELRAKLMSEELNELLMALYEEDLVKISKEIADLLYVTFGTAISYGIPIDEIFMAVHNSNMTKSPSKNEIGKTMKGPDYRPPALEEILELDNEKSS